MSILEHHQYHLITDYRGIEIKLHHTTVDHIRARHREIGDPVAFVTAVLQDPILVTQDELPNTVIYHRAARKPLLHVAYVQVQKGLVKSAHITDTIKGGEILWLRPGNDLIR